MNQPPIDNSEAHAAWPILNRFFRNHPWHGVPIGEDAPEELTAYIEVTPTDTIKYELDKSTGLLRIDRPQLFSNVCPAPYGLIPQTYCGRHIADFCMEQTNFTGIVGDGDPLDICILTEKHIEHVDILLPAIPIGGLRMVDGNEADDKIIAVLKGDGAFGKWKDVRDCPAQLINRLRHYFLTYKDAPNAPHRQVEVSDVYGRDEAHQVIEQSRRDYREKYGDLESFLRETLAKLDE